MRIWDDTETLAHYIGERAVRHRDSSERYRRGAPSPLPIVTVALEGPGMVIQEPTANASAAASTWDIAAECCARWLDGDAAGLDDLVRLMTPVLWQVARACSLGQPEAEDVVQTTWVAFVRSSERLRDAQSVGGWLTTTARREAWRVSRSGTRATALEDDVLEQAVPRQASAETEAIAHDEGDTLWSAVAALDRRCQLLLRIVAFADRPDYAGIARDLDMPVGSIGPTRMRCLRKLRALLAEGGG